MAGSMSNAIAGQGKSVVRAGLLTYLDASFYQSYPGTGTTWTDISGSGRNGSLNNGPIWSNTQGGGYISFDGNGDTMTFPTSFTISTSSGFTVDMWVYINNPQRSSTWNYWYNPVTDVEWGTYGTNGIFTFKDNGASGNPQLNSNLAQNTWGHLAIGCNAQAPFMYSNGVSNGTAGNFRNLNLTVGTICRSKIFHAQIKFYNRALSAAEIQQNFCAGRGRFGI